MYGQTLESHQSTFCRYRVRLYWLSPVSRPAAHYLWRISAPQQVGIWIGRVHDVPHARSTGRLHCVMRTHGISFPFSVFGPSPCPGHYPGRWATTASADFCPITLAGFPARRYERKKRCLRAIDGSLTPGDSIRMCLDLDFPVVRSGIFRRADLIACEADLPG